MRFFKIMLYLSLVCGIANLLLGSYWFVLGHTICIILYLRVLYRIKFKTIRNHTGKLFLVRLAFYKEDGSSYKIHLILRDDIDEPHTHPWDFKSFLIIPYKEIVIDEFYLGDYLTERNEFATKYNHKPFTIVKRDMNQRHLTTLYRVFGIPIPAITIGSYSEKKQLCSFCVSHGRCMSNSK